MTLKVLSDGPSGPLQPPTGRLATLQAADEAVSSGRQGPCLLPLHTHRWAQGVGGGEDQEVG